MTVTDSYIHDLANPPNAHVDGFQCNAKCGVTLRHNTILNEWPQTAAIALFGDFGTPVNSVIDDNLLAGGGYAVYGGTSASTGIEIHQQPLLDDVLPQGRLVRHRLPRQPHRHGQRLERQHLEPRRRGRAVEGGWAGGPDRGGGVLQQRPRHRAVARLPPRRPREPRRPTSSSSTTTPPTTASRSSMPVPTARWCVPATTGTRPDQRRGVSGPAHRRSRPRPRPGRRAGAGRGPADVRRPPPARRRDRGALGPMAAGACSSRCVASPPCSGRSDLLGLGWQSSQSASVTPRHTPSSTSSTGRSGPRSSSRDLAMMRSVAGTSRSSSTRRRPTSACAPGIWATPPSSCRTRRCATRAAGESGQSPATHGMQVVNRVRLYRRRHGWLASAASFALIVANKPTKETRIGRGGGERYFGGRFATCSDPACARRSSTPRARSSRGSRTRRRGLATAVPWPVPFYRQGRGCLSRCSRRRMRRSGSSTCRCWRRRWTRCCRATRSRCRTRSSTGRSVRTRT